MLFLFLFPLSPPYTSFIWNSNQDYQQRSITFINNQIRTNIWTPIKSTFSTPPVLLKSLTLPREDDGVVTSGGGNMVLS